MAEKLRAAVGSISGPIIPNRAFALDQVIVTTLDDTFIGIVIVGIPEDDACGVWRVENGGGAAISVNSLFSTTKDHAATYNCYFEGGYLKFQNKVAGGKTLKVSAYGLEPATE
jgi:hypothetical protein